MVHTLDWTNMRTSGATTGYKRAVVWFSTGEIKDTSDLTVDGGLALLNAGYSIQWDGSPVETSWSAHSFRDPRGVLREAALHPDGSLRCAVAEFEASLAAGAAAPTAPTLQATVVTRTNTPPTASYQTTGIDALQVSVQYTDDENSTTYGPTDVLTAARNGTNYATKYEDNIGLRKLIFAESYFGRGRHHKNERLLGHNNFGGATNPPVEVSGNFHALMDFEFPSGQTWGIMTLELALDCMLPYPAEPCDDGARYPAHPTRPSLRKSHLPELCTCIPHDASDPTNSEDLESPVNADISGLKVTIGRSDAGTIYAYPMYMTDSAAGTGPWGTLIDEGSGVFSFNPAGCATFQGIPMRFAISFASAAEAEFIAKNYTTYYGGEAYASAVLNRRTCTLPYSGESLDMAGYTGAILRDITATKITSWFTGCATDYATFMNADSSNPWDLMGASPYTPQGGGSRQILWFQEGDTFLSFNPYRLYVYGAQVLREWSCRRSLMWQLDTTACDWVSQKTGGRYSHAIQLFGASINERGSRHMLGLYGAPAADTNKAYYNGSVRSTSNPDAQITTTDTFMPLDGEHFGTRPLFLWAMFTADPWALRRLFHYGWIGLFNHHSGAFGNQASPDSTNGRSHLRMHLTTTIEAMIASGYRTFGDLIGERISGWDQPGNFCEWGPPVGKYFQYLDIRYYPGKACGFTGGSIDIDGWHTTGWQMSGIIAPILLIYAYEYGDSTTAGTWGLAGARVADHFCQWWSKMAVEMFSSMSPENVAAASAVASDFDSCWTTIAANNALAARAGFATCKLHTYDRTNSTHWNYVFSNICHDPDPRRGGQVTQDHAILQIGELYKSSNHMTTGHLNRLRKLRQLIEIQFPQLVNGDGHNDTDGALFGTVIPDAPSGQDPPVATFTINASSGEPPLSVAFDASGSTVDGDATLATYEWWYHYDGGSPTQTIVGAGGQTWSYDYAIAGTYSPRLKITDDLGQEDFYELRGGIVVREATSNDPPVVALGITNGSGNAPLTVSFSASASTVNGDASLAVYRWWAHYNPDIVTTPDLTVVGTSGQSWSHVYPSPGTYSPRLAITDSFGQTGILHKINGVRVADPQTPGNPVLIVTSDTQSGSAPLTVNFDASGSVYESAEGDVLFEWYYDEGDSEAAASYGGDEQKTWAAVYSEDGIYRPKLVFYEEAVATGQWIAGNEERILVGDDPGAITPAFTVNPTTIDPNQWFVISNTTTIPTGGLATGWSWEYRGPQTGEAWIEFATEFQPLALSLIEPGTYDIRLTVTGPAGTATTTDEDAVTVRSIGTTPVASFSLTTYTTPDPDAWVGFNNNSTNYKTANWDFGDGTHFTGPFPPPKQYGAPGLYTISLTVVDAANVSSTATKVLLIYSGKESGGIFYGDVDQGASQ